MDDRYDVMIIGGGAAGRSAALVMGRARRNVALVDAGEPSNRVATGIGGFLGNDRRPPAEFYAATRQELDHYPTIRWYQHAVTGLHRAEAEADDNGGNSGWIATLDDGTTIHATQVVLAMGMRYDKPEIPGIEPFWGESVFHCPFCHGWEHRDQPLLILALGHMLAERAALLANWSDDVTVIVPRGADLTDDERTRLRAVGLKVVDGEIVKLHGDPATRELEGAELEDGTVVPARGMLVAAPHVQRSELAAQTGVAIDETNHVVVDATGRTSVDGIWAVGDITTAMAMVVHAAALGAVTASHVVKALVDAEAEAKIKASAATIR
jgi:thioredoxin reductase